MAFTTLAGIKTALNRAPNKLFLRNPSTAASVNAWYSSWLGNFEPPPGVAPTSGLSGSIPTNTTVGAIPIDNAVSGSNFLIDLSVVTSTVPGVLYIYDRLWHNSGLDMTITTSQTINSVALDRPDVNGVNAELWLDSYTAIGAGTPVITATYTNSSGTGSRTATLQNIASSASQGRTFPFALDAGDIGVKSVQSFIMSISRTSGTAGLVIRRRIATIPLIYISQWVKSDVLSIPLRKIETNGCLETIWFNATGTSTNAVAQGNLTVANA